MLTLIISKVKKKNYILYIHISTEGGSALSVPWIAVLKNTQGQDNILQPHIDLIIQTQTELLDSQWEKCNLHSSDVFALK